MGLNQEDLSPEEELVQSLLTITQGFSARLNGLRNYCQSSKKGLHADVGAEDPAQSDPGSRVGFRQKSHACQRRNESGWL